MFLKFGTHRIVWGKLQISWLWGRVAEVKGGTVYASSVPMTRGVSKE